MRRRTCRCSAPCLRYPRSWAPGPPARPSGSPSIDAMNSDLFRFASPQAFFPVAGKLIPWFSVLAGVLALAGLYIAFFVAPTDATQGEAYRIIFIHVPAAWMSMFIYLVMAGWCAMSLTFNARLSAMMAQALGPPGVGYVLGLGRPHDV